MAALAKCVSEAATLRLRGARKCITQLSNHASPGEFNRTDDQNRGGCGWVIKRELPAAHDNELS